MLGKLKKGYRWLVINEGQEQLIVSTKLSKKEFIDKLKTNRFIPHRNSWNVNYNGNISSNYFNPISQ